MIDQVRNIFAAVRDHWWVVVLAALAAAVATLALGLLSGTNDSQARVRVGLTSESEWPLYQSDLESFGNIARGDALLQPIRDDLGDQSLEARIDIVEGLFVSDLTVTAANDANALEAVERLTEQSISLQAQQADGGQTEDLERLKQDLAASLDRVAELEAAEEQALTAANDAAAAVDAEYTTTRDLAFRQAASALSQARGKRNEAQTRSQELGNQVDQIEGRRDVVTKRLFVIDDPSVVEDASPLSEPVAPILAAIAAALAAGAWAVSRDRLHGPVRSAQQLENAMGEPVLASLGGNDPKDFDGVRLNHALARLGPHEQIEVVWTAKPGKGADEQLRELLDEAAADGPTPVNELSTLVKSPTSTSAGAILVVARNRTRVDSVDERLRRLKLGGKDFLGFILAS